MKPKEIQELIEFISQTGLDEVNIETESFKLSVKKNSGVVRVGQESSAVAPVILPVAPQVAAIPAANTVADLSAAKPAAAGADSSKYITVKSPMIGTFYKTPNPDSPPFVNVGDTISVGQTVCIIEAMKLFNEIESEVAGKVVKILVENATPVEYDQPLFLVDPS
jgi:acetyl-CoA carboxylase biotin carboxyl carrier protein